MDRSARERRARRIGRISAVAATGLLLGGIALIGISVASQRWAPQRPRAVTNTDSRSSPFMFASLRAARRVLREISPKFTPPTLARSKPVSLDIPSIGVHSNLQHLGQTSDGKLETPAPGPLYDVPAWYRYSPAPGSVGPAILLGHVDSAAEGPSVFFRLGELRPGARVLVTRADDSVAVFIVKRIRRYAKDDFPTDRVYGDIDFAGLRILTCGGAFDDAAGHYLDNIVVFASLKGSFALPTR